MRLNIIKIYSVFIQKIPCKLDEAITSEIYKTLNLNEICIGYFILISQYIS